MINHSHGHRHLPCVGAAISILGLAVSPITQQMVSYPIRTVATNFGSGDAASAPRSDFFMGSVLMSGSNGKNSNTGQKLKLG